MRAKNLLVLQELITNKHYTQPSGELSRKKYNFIFATARIVQIQPHKKLNQSTRLEQTQPKSYHATKKHGFKVTNRSHQKVLSSEKNGQ